MLQCVAMPTERVPELPNFRITLFYGPEPLEGRPSVQRCVFNVKKRSWKGGVQVVVELEEAQLSRARASIEFHEWLTRSVAGVPADERELYERRAGDLFVQHLAALKLDLAIEAGLSQQNQQVHSGAFTAELDERVVQSANQLKSDLLIELDLPAPGH